MELLLPLCDYRCNGLLLRRDMHGLFDENMITICLKSLIINVFTDALAVDTDTDTDLAVFHSLRIADTRKPINPQYLVSRWDTFQRLNAI
ncbi:hypothetical protein NLN86_18410 [Citrobacter portucalensis]|uniref:HNH nuclease domain-containing protein n=1 Tax=Citrobacter portucalensis TaxID=1639133 RepID=A0AAW5WAV9_9ENTR|nr:hypothetical protein [Citrobacter portucalensis]